MTRILVVDDLKDITETMGVLFEALGHDTQVAADGRQAVETTLAFEPDIIFLDLDMPVLNGYEAAREIRGAPLPRQPFLIALTQAHAGRRAGAGVRDRLRAGAAQPSPSDRGDAGRRTGAALAARCSAGSGRIGGRAAHRAGLKIRAGTQRAFGVDRP